MLLMCRSSTRVHGPLRVQAVRAALIGLSTQSDSDWLLRQTTRADRPAPTEARGVNRTARLDKPLSDGGEIKPKGVWLVPAKGPATLGSGGTPSVIRAAVVGAHVSCIRQRPGGHGAVCQRHQVTGRLRFGDFERC